MIVYLVPDFIISNKLVESTYFNFKLYIVKMMDVHCLACHPQRTGSVLHPLVCLCIAYTVCLLRDNTV